MNEENRSLFMFIDSVADWADKYINKEKQEKL